MKRIKQYKKLFEVEGPINLKDLKKSYRGLVKKWHPDKFTDEAQDFYNEMYDEYEGMANEIMGVYSDNEKEELEQ